MILDFIPCVLKYYNVAHLIASEILAVRRCKLSTSVW